MRRVQFERFLRQIYSTEEEEISCSECFDLVSQYVDLEIAGEPVNEQLPHLRQHLEQCRVCQEEYEMLLDIARLEAEGHTPSVDDLRKKL